ncbi:MAG: hypothetical protein OTJ44_00570 [Planctomycetota bacterium]|nr:hypothetical protein [Planctomycetota bacterium]
MKTADFLPPEAFAEHLDRRRTPKRLAWLCTWALLGLSATFALEWEVQAQVSQARQAQAPDAPVQQARAEMDRVYGAMNAYAVSMDPLTDHLSLPQVGALLTALPQLLGQEAELEDVLWKHEVVRRGRNVQSAQLLLRITAEVRGETALISLPEQLRVDTGFTSVKMIRTEVLPEKRDSVRLELEFRAPLELPLNPQQGSVR